MPLVCDWFTQTPSPSFTLDSLSFSRDFTICAHAKFEYRQGRLNTERRDVTSLFLHGDAPEKILVNSRQLTWVVRNRQIACTIVRLLFVQIDHKNAWLILKLP